MIGTIPIVIKEMLIPTTCSHRTGKALKPTTLTIHNTGNLKSTPEGERNWLLNPENEGSVGWHYCVGEKSAVLAIPENEVAYHAGSASGNNSSLSIEVCESGDWDKTYKNAVGLAAHILNEHGWTSKQLRKHKDWNGKECPRKIIPIWDKFLADVDETIKAIKTPVKEPAKPEAVKKPAEIKTEPWMLEGLNYLHKEGIVTDLEGWTSKASSPMPTWAVMTVLAKMHKNIIQKTGGQ